jgi:uncharacterized membrane protein
MFIKQPTPIIMTYMATKTAKSREDNLLYIVAYILSWITGIVIFAMSKPSEKRLRFNGLQSIFLGIIGTILFFIPFVGWILGLLLYIVGIVSGIKAYYGEDVILPVIGQYAKKYID